MSVRQAAERFQPRQAGIGHAFAALQVQFAELAEPGKVLQAGVAGRRVHQIQHREVLQAPQVCQAGVGDPRVPQFQALKAGHLADVFQPGVGQGGLAEVQPPQVRRPLRLLSPWPSIVIPQGELVKVGKTPMGASPASLTAASCIRSRFSRSVKPATTFNPSSVRSVSSKDGSQASSSP